MRYIADDGWSVIADETFVGIPKSGKADNHAYVVAENRTRHLRCTFTANGASESIKASNKRDLDFIDCAATRGVEDAGDFIDCHNVLFRRTAFGGDDGPQDITAKGGCSGFKFEHCSGLRRIELGNYTIYDGQAMRRWLRFWPRSPKTTGTLVSSCGNPRVTSFWADRAHGDCRTFRWWPVATAVFFYVRRNFFKEKGANAAKIS